jgi:hypothetical protein
MGWDPGFERWNEKGVYNVTGNEGRIHVNIS